jgi:hypothetical protein
MESSGKFSQASSFAGWSSMPFSELRLSEYQSIPGNNPGSNLLTKKQTQHLPQMSYLQGNKFTLLEKKKQIFIYLN